jgi:hypothetical protein
LVRGDFASFVVVECLQQERGDDKCAYETSAAC